MDMNLVWLVVLMLACAFIYTHSLYVLAVKVVTSLPVCAATSKRWRLIDFTICTNNLMSWSIFYKAVMLLLKGCTIKLYLGQRMRVRYLISYAHVVL